MKKKHLLRSIIAMVLCVLMIGTAIAVGYTVYENAQGKKVVIDKDNNKPFVSGSASATVTTENGVTKEEVTLKSSDESILAVIPAGTKLNDGVKEVTLTVKEIKNGQANVELEENEEKSSYDVHVEGVATDNTTPIKVVVKEMLAKGLNIGNYKLYHVENGTTVEMTLLNGEVTHNSFEYDPATGDVTLYLASFSEVAVVSTETGEWKGGVDYSWYDANAEVFEIANADQLAAFGKIVGGMADDYAVDNFEGKTVKLIADIDLNDNEDSNNSWIFHPIGYYYNENYKFEDGSIGIYSNVNSFNGTFNGNGHTISNFYQNTWEIKGDYDANYYKDAMGLFGYIVNGRVENLTVNEFASDGEFTPTGVIAAYAVNSTFENIAITNCNPRVYNTGNGGIVGVAGNSDDTDAKSLTFANITVDQTNKISALWGSWDVACGGIMGMFRGNGLVTMTNCHVAAMIDVNNDVCANYQYYWYRYSGMFIGSIRKNTTEGNYTVADTTGIAATNCTYTLGDWNEYWYCELVANSIASYTHDHQFSRLTKIASLKDIQDENGNWNVVGNFVIPNDDNTSAECYHIFKNANGELYQHFHDVADESNPNIYETFDLNGDGLLNDLKEDRTCYYMPFNQILNGNGYGVKAHYAFNGITEVKDGTVLSGEKFEIVNGAPTTYRPGQTIIIGDLFESTVDDTKLSKISIFVAVSSKTENDNVKAVYQLDLSDWKNSKITFDEDCVGSAKIIITDYFYCTPTVIYLDPEPKTAKFDANAIDNQDAYTQITLGALFGVEDGAVIGNVTTTVTDPNGNVTTVTGTSEDWTTKTIDLIKEGAWTVSIKDDDEYCLPTETTFTVNKVDKFENEFDKDFLYRVGNATNSPVTLGTIFSEIETAVALSSVDVTITNVAGNASGTFTSNATWSNGKIQFSGTGIVKVTISADGANEVSINLEVIDAVNATGATSATANNVVLLNDCGFSTITVSDGYTLYGNGFTMTCGSDSAVLDMGYAFVTLENGTLDNVQIVCPDFDYAALYKTNLTSTDNRNQTTNGTTRYYNAMSGIMAKGNSQILNSFVSGARAAVNVSGGNLVIDNSRIEGGAVATILVGAANSLTLKDVTLVQMPTVSTYDSSKTLMGFSVLYMCDSEGKATPTTLEGKLIQNAWAGEDEKQYVPSAGQGIVDTIMGEDTYIHSIEGKDKVNLGFAYMPEDTSNTVEAPDNITDNRTDKATIPYEQKDVKINISIISTTVYVYSYKSTTNGTADSFINVNDYTPNAYSDIITVSYADTSEGLTNSKTYGADGWIFELNVDLDKLSGYALDFSKVTMSVNGTVVSNFKVDDADKPTTPITVVAGGTTYVLTATLNDKDYTANFKVTGTETSKDSPSLVASDYEAGLCVASSYGGTWHGAAPALKGIQIRYWSVAEKQYKTINLADYTPTTKGQLNGTNTTWTYSPDNGDFTLTLTGGQVHSSNNVYAMPVCVDTDSDGTADTLYFVAASSNGLVNTGNDARTVPVSYSFKDNNNGDVLKFSNTWSVAENKDEQYKYSDFCDGTMTQLENCIAPDTLITLADGTQVRVDSLTGNEELLVWNLETGMLDKAPIMFVDSEDEAEYKVVNLIFSDGTVVKVIGEHGFWDYDLNKYVYLDESASEYVGHYFAKQNGDALEKVQLADVAIETVVTTAWSPVTVGHLCYFVNGMLSMPGGVGGLFNIFEVDADTMTYDYDAMAEDIEKYGLFTYEELNAIAPLSREMFEQAGGAYLKISIAKGNLTMEELIYMINRYSIFF